MRVADESAMLGIHPAARPPEIPDHALLCLIGHGSYGEVWLARNAVGRLRAVKIVRRESFQHSDHFEREFKGLLKFEPISRSHDGLVDILQIGRRDDAGYFYYVMELADGEEMQNEKCKMKIGDAANSTASEREQSILNYHPKTLRSELQAHGHLPPDECIALGLKLARALQHLHAHGLVHRDIKPSNIIFVDGEPKLADIGLVTAIDEAHSLVGTVGYIPPEGPGTPQADLFSLGKVLYEIAFGKDRQEFPQLPANLEFQPDYAALLELNEVILKACETDPHRRYASASALGEDLTRLQVGRSVKRHRTVERRRAFVQKYGLATAGVSLLVAVVWLLSTRFAGPSSQRMTDAAAAPPSATIAVKSVAVLPFDNESPDKADEYLGTQLAEEWSSTLTKIPELRVLGRETAAGLKNSKDRRAVAQQLRLDATLEGRVRKSGNRLQLTAQLVNAADSFLLWSETYDREMPEIFGIQTEVAEKVAEKLTRKLTDTVQASLARKTTRNHEAYHCYLEGRDFLDRGALAKAFASFLEATRLDTNFALAYAGLSIIHSTWDAPKALRLSPEANSSNALALAERAVRLDRSSVEAHTALASAKYHLYDWNGAEKEFQLARQLNPNYAHLYLRYAYLLRALGRFDEDIAAVQLAKELDPWSRTIRRHLGWALFHARHHAEAQKEFEALLKLDQNVSAGWDGLGDCYEAMGKPDEAVAAWEKALRLYVAPDKIAELTQAYKAAGLRGYRQTELEQMLKEASRGGYVDSFWIADVYARLGDSDQAFAWLDRAYDDRHPWMPEVAVEYGFYNLHSDPRFTALLRKMGLKMPVWKK